MAFQGTLKEFRATPLWGNGPTPGDLYNFPAKSLQTDFRQHSQTPITTGTSVLGIKFDGGVMIAADMLGSYGSLARFRNVSRVLKVNSNILIGAGGDYGDYQYLRDIIEQKIIDEECLDDGFVLKPKSLHCWLTRVLYNRRSKNDPLWNNFLVAGIQDNKPFLGNVDKLGTAYEETHIVTGFGTHLATPLMRKAVELTPLLSRLEAQRLLIKCMEVLYYRDARAFNKYEIGTVTAAEGVEITPPLTVSGNWDVANYVRGYE